MPSPYGKAYFDKWYRDPRHRVSTPHTLARKAMLAVAVAEYYLDRPVRTALDVGCGEGQWRLALKKLRPDIRYTGIDPSPYAVRRFGKRRSILLGSFGELPRMSASYDLIICNLLAEPIIAWAPQMQSHLAPNGLCLLSGILAWFAEDAEIAYKNMGLEAIHRIDRSPWVTLMLQRKAT